MRKTIENITCDICGKKIVSMENTQDNYSDTLSRATDTHRISVEGIRIDIYYGGIREAKDICRECSDKIVDLLRTIVKDGNITNIPRMN
jgi:hypothetical protein